MSYPYRSDEEAVEPLLNDTMAEADGVKKNLRIQSAKNVLEGYMPANQDDAGGGVMYNGFLDKDGNWYIMQSTTVATVTTYLYFKGTTTYAAGWAGRGGLTYDVFNVIF